MCAYTTRADPISVKIITDGIKNSGAWVGVGAAIGAAIYAITNEPTWIAVGVAVGAALSWRKPKKK